MNNGKLTRYINSHEWWRTALPDEKAVEARDLFYASSYRDAEFYGRPIDTPFNVDVSNPLFGDDAHIMHTLGLPVASEGITVGKRFALDAKMTHLGRAKGYDSVALMTATEYRRFITTGRVPRSIELQVFSALNERAQ